jgi:hypothetical protein
MGESSRNRFYKQKKKRKRKIGLLRKFSLLYLLPTTCRKKNAYGDDDACPCISKFQVEHCWTNLVKSDMIKLACLWAEI